MSVEKKILYGLGQVAIFVVASLAIGVIMSMLGVDDSLVVFSPVVCGVPWLTGAIVIGLLRGFRS